MTFLDNFDQKPLFLLVFYLFTPIVILIDFLNNRKVKTMYYNLYTKKSFSGINLERLQATNLTGGFCTFNQARKMKAKVIKGSKAVARLTRLVTEGKEDEFRTYPVFHSSQIQFREEVQ